jgi:D-lactate dehydrogenase (cytochrome)
MLAATDSLDRLKEELGVALGANHVIDSEAVRAQHSMGESFHKAGLPDVVVHPGSTEDVVAVVHLCRAHRVPLVPFGAGTSLEGHVVPLQGGVSLDTSRLNRIVRLSVEDLDVQVESGVTRKQLDARLRPEGVFFPVDPGADATIDLTHLFIGSEGTLGVITEATLRIYPSPEAISSAVCSFASLDAAVRVVIETIQLGIPIARIELLDDVQMDAVNRRSGLGYPVAHTLFLEFHGGAAEVAAQAEEVGTLAREHGGGDFAWATNEDERGALWAARHHAYEAALALRPGSKGYITDVCVPISELARTITDARRAIETAGLLAPIVGHVGDGNFHVCFLVDPSLPEELAQVSAVVDDIAKRAIAVGGTCTGEHGVGYGKTKFLRLEYGEEGVDLMRRVKSAIDPDAIMNPGKVLPEP